MGGERTGKQTGLGFENWVFWYHNNKEDIENLKKALYTNVGTDNPLFVMGGKVDSNRGDSTQDTRAAAVNKIIPALLWAMDPKNSGHQDTESAAYIALAKIARDPAHIDLIKKGLDLAGNTLTIESSALALGLLRREKEGDRFSAADLDKVRDTLFSLFENDKYHTRARGFAALAIGLLGDQPTGSSGTDASAAAAATTTRLFTLLEKDYGAQDLPVGLLMAIGLQPAPSITEAQRDLLRDCANKGLIGKIDISGVVQSYAVLALGRVGNSKDIAVLSRAMTNRRAKDKNVQRSAAIGLGLLGRLVSGVDRVEVAKTLLASIDKAKDASTENFAVISLAYLLIEDVKAGKTDVLTGSKAGEYLLQTAEDGKYLAKPFGALALALVGREIGEETTIDALGEFRSKSQAILRAGLESKKLDPRGRAAFATSLGIIKDNQSVKALVALVSSDKEDEELRGYSALALGLIGQATGDVKTAIRGALKERRSDELRQQTATALGLLQDKEAVPLLLEELKNATSQNAKGQVVLALAKVGDARAVDDMVALLQDKREQDLTRALACAGLGVIGDLEWLPSLSRISKNLNYRASVDIINEVVTIV
jgi:HEAT repeat protein